MNKRLKTSLTTLPLITALSLAVGVTGAQAQSFSVPLEITDCTTIDNVTSDSWYVLTTDLTDCKDTAILVKNNTGRVIIDLNGKTLSNTPGVNCGLCLGIWIHDSPGAAVRGNYHHRTDSGQWGATLSGFRMALTVERSEEVSIGSSGVKNGGLYVEDNQYGVYATLSDDLYLNNFSMRDSSNTAVVIYSSDSPVIRSVNVNGGADGFGVRLLTSPNAKLWGASGRVGDNIKGLEIGHGSDNAHIYSWQAHRAVSAGHSSGISIFAEDVIIDKAVFSQTGPANRCDLSVSPHVVNKPTIGSTRSYPGAMTTCQD